MKVNIYEKTLKFEYEFDRLSLSRDIDRLMFINSDEKESKLYSQLMAYKRILADVWRYVYKRSLGEEWTFVKTIQNVPALKVNKLKIDGVDHEVLDHSYDTDKNELNIYIDRENFKFEGLKGRKEIMEAAVVDIQDKIKNVESSLAGWSTPFEKKREGFWRKLFKI